MVKKNDVGRMKMEGSFPGIAQTGLTVQRACILYTMKVKN